jgi:hypothetical protein
MNPYIQVGDYVLTQRVPDDTWQNWTVWIGKQRAAQDVRWNVIGVVVARTYVSHRCSFYEVAVREDGAEGHYHVGVYEAAELIRIGPEEPTPRLEPLEVDAFTILTEDFIV